MIRDFFRVLKVDLKTGKARVVQFPGRLEHLGGNGLAAALFQEYGLPDQEWDHPDQPFILGIGSLTGYFPLMSKTVSAFKSPYHNQYAESHAGGRSALALRFADYDALVVTGQALSPVCLDIGPNHFRIVEASYLWGMDIQSCGKILRRMVKGSGHRTILRIGPAGENKSGMACINVDSYRHFGRLGGGAVMGAKKIKAIAIQGDSSFQLPSPRSRYNKLFAKIFSMLTRTDMMSKYHNYGTAVNLDALNGLKSLPWRNLQATQDPAIESITGQKFADETLLRSTACSGCPVGCIHIGFLREKFQEENQYLYRQVSYDSEPIFAVGSMLGVTKPFQVLKIMDEVEKVGLDVMSGGVALAWATEAFQKGIISEAETITPLKFGDSAAYCRAVDYLGTARNDFYALLSQGTLKAAKEYGGEDFACVLGQEMAGYATGEVFFTAQSLGFRHSHLDTGGYSFDQKHKEQDVPGVIEFFVKDEQERVILTSMVSCLFARGVYSLELLGEAMQAIGYSVSPEELQQTGVKIQSLRWKTRIQTGFDPLAVHIPKRFLEVVTWKGKIDPDYLEKLRVAYGGAIIGMGKNNQL